MSEEMLALNEAARVDAEGRLRAMMDAMAQGAILVDADNRILAVNGQVAEIWGVDRSFLQVDASIMPAIAAMARRLGQDEHGFLAQSRDTHRKLMNGQLQAFEFEAIDGRVIEVRAKPTQNGGFVATYSDMTETRSAHSAMARNAAQIAAVMANMAQGVVLTDAEFTIQASNVQAATLLGVETKHLSPGASFIDFLNVYAALRGEDARSVRRTTRDALRQLLCGEVQAYEFIGASGTPLEVRAKPTENGFVTTYTDISYRKRVEAELIEARDAAEAASRAKSGFLATMSHELRTPMNALLGSAELLKRRPLDDEAREHVETLTEAGAVLLAVLNDVLDLSKIEAGKMEVEKTATDLSRLMLELDKLWRPRAEEKGLSFHIAVQPEAPRWVLSDPTRLRQILFNLLSNALKFTSCGAVRADLLAEPLSNGGWRVRISVNDSGVGISSEAQSRLFGAFEQADGSITRRFGGTGLGLAICDRLARLLGGSIAVVSELDVGSTFTLCFDVEEARAPALQPETDLPGCIGAGQPLRVMAAEDNVVNQKLIAAFLSALNCEVTIVSDGAAALEAAERTRFDLVLMDVQMPMMDGLEATRRLRAGQSCNRDIPVVALTANALSTDRALCLDAGMTDYLTKPIDPRALAAIVHRYANARPASAAA
jgi:signal transduction histidine kinase/ActR/RegA family two-component response regulator